MNLFILAEAQNTADAGSVSWVGPIIYLIVIVAAFYFFFYRPQSNRDKERNAVISSIEIRDRVLTTSGFYGVVLDVLDDNDIVVEFGNNKNCRIVMVKTAIAEVEKPE